MQYVEYIETDGYCWFDTGLIPTVDTKVEMVNLWPGVRAGEWPVYFGKSDTDWTNCTYTFKSNNDGNAFDSRFGNQLKDSYCSFTVGSNYNVVFDATGVTINNTLYAWSSTPVLSSDNHTLWLAAENNDSRGGDWNRHRASIAKFGEIKVWENNVLIGDFKPAVDNNSNVGFYDEVTSTFKQNLGTGTPVAGPSLSSIAAEASKTSLAASGETINITVTCENAWTATGNTFLTLSSTGDTGSTTITATAPSYTGATARTDTLTFIDTVTGDEAEITIRQKKYTSGQPFYLGANEVSEIYLGDVAITEAYLGDILVFSTGPTPPPPPPIDYRSMPLTIESIDTNDLQLLSYHMSNTYSGKYSINSGAPVSFTVTSGNALTITGLSAGDKVQFTVDTDQTIGIDTSNYRYFSSTGRFNVYGNAMSVIYANYTSANAYDRTIAELFDSSKVVDASNLWLGDENTSIISNCFRAMFFGCTGLTAAPALPFTTLAFNCYQAMFKNCTSLTTAPELPATTLANSCYRQMFQSCTSLTTAPVLSAAVVPQEAYYQMFSVCSSLNYIKCLATSLGTSATFYWASSVSATGTFVKDASASWTTGVSGIPNGWTVVDAS